MVLAFTFQKNIEFNNKTESRHYFLVYILGEKKHMLHYKKDCRTCIICKTNDKEATTKVN